MNQPELLARIRAGHYARKQLFVGSWLIRWSHRCRLATALELARPFSNGTLLDYGCGDGTFLALLMASAQRPASAVGADIWPEVIADCRERLGQPPGLAFMLASELAGAAHAGQYDALFCLEVLEHVVDVASLLRQFEQLLKPTGTLVISVPVETGLPLAVKQLARRLAGWRKLGDYPWTSTYSPGKFWASLIAGSQQHVPRAPFRNPDGTESYGHYGFNWMALRQTVARHFAVSRVFGSPLRWLPPHLASQAWFVAAKKPCALSSP
jgi:SAM-dependent methyltransferase